jgi:hypothetical protein
MNYSNGVNYGWARDIDDEKVYEISEPVITNHSVTVTYQFLNSTFSHEQIEGIAYEVDESIFWFDRVPNSKKEIEKKPFNGTLPPQFNTTNDNKDTSSTPGFEVTTIFILLIFIAVLFYKKYKK